VYTSINLKKRLRLVLQEIFLKKAPLPQEVTAQYEDLPVEQDMEVEESGIGDPESVKAYGSVYVLVLKKILKQNNLKILIKLIEKEYKQK
jgi:hypothetical protein